MLLSTYFQLKMRLKKLEHLMLASALEGDCGIIFTEDMSNGQVINETLKIVNPFV